MTDVRATSEAFAEQAEMLRILESLVDRIDRRLRALENRTSSIETWINDHAPRRPSDPETPLREGWHHD